MSAQDPQGSGQKSYGLLALLISAAAAVLAFLSFIAVKLAG